MSLYHDYRYDLRVEGADENTLSAFAKAFESTCFIDYMGQDSDDPALFSTEVVEGSGGEYEETVEKDLHKLAMQFPQLTLHFIAEDLDDRGHGYELRFHGDLYQRADVVTRSSGLCPPVPFEQRQEAMQIHAARDLKVNILLDKICTSTDFDLLYAQKKALRGALHEGTPIPKEALSGLINFLDYMGDLGEALGRFQYDGIEPPFPMLPEYQKREVTFTPEPTPKLHVLCEEHEDNFNIREFTVLGISTSEEEMQKLMEAKIKRDDYDLISKNGVDTSCLRDNHFSTNYDEHTGIVEYYIVEQELLTPDRVQELLSSREYADTFEYPDNLRDILGEAIRYAIEDMDYTDIDMSKAVDQILADKMFRSMVRGATWAYGSNASHIDEAFWSQHAFHDCLHYVFDAIANDANLFEKSGARPAFECPAKLKQILINSIYDVCRDLHQMVIKPVDQAERYMQMSSFRDTMKFPGNQSLEEGTEAYKAAVSACYDFVKNQILPEKEEDAPALDTMIQTAREKAKPAKASAKEPPREK